MIYHAIITKNMDLAKANKLKFYIPRAVARGYLKKLSVE
jgi:hypothetical protein